VPGLGFSGPWRVQQDLQEDQGQVSRRGWMYSQAELRFQAEATDKHDGSAPPRRVGGEVETGVEEAAVDDW
jgi:hypothetical protein